MELEGLEEESGIASGPRGGDCSSPAFPGDGIMVVATVGVVGGWRSGCTWRRASCVTPCGKWGFDIGGPNKYNEVYKRGTRGDSERIW